MINKIAHSVADALAGIEDLRMLGQIQRSGLKGEQGESNERNVLFHDDTSLYG